MPEAMPVHGIRPAGLPARHPVSPEIEALRPIDAVVVKLAARCNMACSYCYWFRDPSVMALPKRMGEDVAAQLIARLREHILDHRLDRFVLVLHGGEPLLFGKAAFLRLGLAAEALAAETGCDIRLCITTNGLLIDEDWVLLFIRFRVAVTLSLDGPAEQHDRVRFDLRGRPTHARTVAALEQLRVFGQEPGILAVADPAGDPDALLDHFVAELGLRELDVLIPDATADDTPPSIAPFFIGLFDRWWNAYATAGVRIRLFDAIIAGLVGASSGVESIGYGPVRAATISSDGAIEAHDVCRITGRTGAGLNLATDALDDIRATEPWRAIFDASLDLAPACRECPWARVCGGGHIASRWSSRNGFANPSVYCADLKALISHIWARIGPDLEFTTLQSTAPETLHA
ncbi:radical SAM protein [Asticcacaulis solisilvae]|uniref:radical SAM protein n=1 Tax=Asticcacaulis solisilvae TaxID=1217274 RepID=UPI003FD7B1C4